MNKPANVDLVGYLLGALDDQEREQVEAALECDPQLQRQLQSVDDHLHDMRVACNDAEPPAGLADRTCVAVANSSYGIRLAADTSERAPASPRWSMVDIAVALSICLAVATLLFPALVASRQNAQVIACQDKLRELGTALQTYNNRHGGAFPAPPADGNLAVAGSYGPMLFDAGYFDDPTLLICPTSDLADQLDQWRLPTVLELENAHGKRLLALQRTMGGSFAYTMGYVKGGRYYPTRNLGRPRFVVMSDAPLRTEDGWASANHGGRGQNVLFEDFHIEFVKDCCFHPGGDVFFENHDGLPAAGLDPNDAVVGASATPPLRFIKLNR